MENPFLTPRYDSDKIQSGLLQEYKQILNPLIYQPISLLEIGIFKGGSLLYWDSYLKHPEASILGVDLNIPEIDVSKRVKMHHCDQNDSPGLLEIANKYGPFDLIIDDGSHYAPETRNCFETLFPFVKTGGYYAIEDWAVGYFSEQLPQYDGMVEFITELISQLPSMGFESIRTILETGKAIAIFQKSPPAI